MTKASIYRRSRSNNPAVAFPALVRLGEALEVIPTTDTGFRQYGAGRLFLPAATNYCTNPSFETGAANALATGWAHTGGYSITGTPVYSKVAGRTGGVAQRIQYTGVAGDSAGNKKWEIAHWMPDASVASGDKITLSIYIKGTLTGVGGPYLMCYDQAFTGLMTAYECTGVGAGEYTRYSATATAAAGSTKASFYLYANVVGTGDTIDLTIDDVQIEKSAVLTPYGDGSYPGWSWSGTAHASTSVRAVSTLSFPITSWMTPATGTIAARFVPLFPASNTVAQTMLITTGGTGFLRVVHGPSYEYLLYNGGASVTSNTAASSYAAGSVNSLVGRWVGGTSIDFALNGASVAQKANAQTGSGWTVLSVHGANTYSYIGPVAISPFRITDAETATLSAMLTDGATGLELFKWFRDRGYSNTLILPLESDSVGYLVR